LVDVSRDNPIGVFDSGVGGLSVVMEIQRLLPQEDILYLADGANFPYGDKPAERIRQLALGAAGFLIERGAKLVVVACNTASTAALAALRETYQVPFVGMVPAIKPASAATRRGRVGVIATAATVQAEVLEELVTQFASGVKVFTQPCPGLVDLVEQGQFDSVQARNLLRQYLDPLLREDIDILVLGCTHYPFLKPLISEMVGGGVTIVDTGLPVARQVERVLLAQELDRQSGVPGRVTYFTSGDPERLLSVVRKLNLDGAFVDDLPGKAPERLSTKQ